MLTCARSEDSSLRGLEEVAMLGWRMWVVQGSRSYLVQLSFFAPGFLFDAVFDRRCSSDRGFSEALADRRSRFDTLQQTSIIDHVDFRLFLSAATDSPASAPLQIVSLSLQSVHAVQAVRLTCTSTDSPVLSASDRSDAQ